MRAVPHNPERSTAVPKHRNRVIGSHRIPLTNPLDGSKTSKILCFFFVGQDGVTFNGREFRLDIFLSLTFESSSSGFRNASIPFTFIPASPSAR